MLLGWLEWVCLRGKLEITLNSPKLYGSKPRKLKYIFMLFKNILVFITAIILLRRTISKEAEIEKELDLISEDVLINSND